MSRTLPPPPPEDWGGSLNAHPVYWGTGRVIGAMLARVVAGFLFTAGAGMFLALVLYALNAWERACYAALGLLPG